MDILVNNSEGLLRVEKHEFIYMWEKIGHRVAGRVNKTKWKDLAKEWS